MQLMYIHEGRGSHVFVISLDRPSTPPSRPVTCVSETN